MKLSRETLMILSNFAKINNNIFVKAGNALRTCTPAENIVADATIAETLPLDFGIYDLNKFLSAINLFGDQHELTFHDDFVTISGGQSNNLTYRYAEISGLIVPPDQKVEIKNEDVKVRLDKAHLDNVLKAASTLKTEDISFVGDGQTVKLVARTISNPASDEFSLELGQTTKVFNVDFPLTSLVMISGNYEVLMNKKRLSQWNNVDMSVSYVMASSESSTFPAGQ